jgi:hypothetical protein
MATSSKKGSSSKMKVQPGKQTQSRKKTAPAKWKCAKKSQENVEKVEDEEPKGSEPEVVQNKEGDESSNYSEVSIHLFNAKH